MGLAVTAKHVLLRLFATIALFLSCPAYALTEGSTEWESGTHRWTAYSRDFTKEYGISGGASKTSIWLGESYFEVPAPFDTVIAGTALLTGGVIAFTCRLVRRREHAA